MMAKRPADRFATMAEVAAALTPYVAGASASLREIRNTSTWTGAQLVTMTDLPRQRRRRARRAAVVVALAVLLVAGTILSVGLAGGWFRPDDTQVVQGDDVVPGATAKEPPTRPDTGKSPRPETPLKQEEPRDPNVLTVAQKPGVAQFQTITAALEAVKPGQTIRVLDGAVYRESLLIKRASIHTGITLEAPAGAIVETITSNSIPIDILDVQGVTLRQLRVRARNTERCTLVAARGNFSRLRLEDLELSLEGNGSQNNGIELLGYRADPSGAIVQGCRFRGLNVGVVLGTPVSGWSVAHIAVRDSLFTDCAVGVRVDGKVRAVQVVGNRFWGAGYAAFQLLLLSPDSEQIVLANNTCYEATTAFRLWDSAVHGKDVQVRNNLVLGAGGSDMSFVEAADRDTERGPGYGAAVARLYRLDHNWREGRAPTGASARGWVPPDPGKGDVFKENLGGVVNRDPKSPNFLRPDKDSPLATAGAGIIDPSLPRYVGAFPPEGTERWDWDRAWRMPKDAQLLTVSRDADEGGKYRTINAALADARPWATIRVLDAATYRETLRLMDRKKHEGLTLEAIKGATLHLAPGVQRLITIEDVPHVAVSGFTFTETAAANNELAWGRAFVWVSGAVPGLALTRLTLAQEVPMLGFVLQNAVGSPAAPVRIEHCTLKPRVLSNDGIGVIGSLEKEPAGWICIRSNRVFRSQRGINLHGNLRDIHIAGNLVVGCAACGIQLEDLSPSSHGLLVDNNTAFGGQAAFRLWDNVPYEDPVAGQVEVANNLFFAADHCDVAYALDPGMGKLQSAGDGKALVKLWRFHHNRRDFSGFKANLGIPPGPDDARLKRDELLSAAADDPDRVRPGKVSPLATQGAGTNDASLPAYIGALPREGDLPWDWDRTWRIRVRKQVDTAK
jgi:hypothetical protein